MTNHQRQSLRGTRSVATLMSFFLASDFCLWANAYHLSKISHTRPCIYRTDLQQRYVTSSLSIGGFRSFSRQQREHSRLASTDSPYARKDLKRSSGQEKRKKPLMLRVFGQLWFFTLGWIFSGIAKIIFSITGGNNSDSDKKGGKFSPDSSSTTYLNIDNEVTAVETLESIKEMAKREHLDHPVESDFHDNTIAVVSVEKASEMNLTKSKQSELEAARKVVEKKLEEIEQRKRDVIANVNNAQPLPPQERPLVRPAARKVATDAATTTAAAVRKTSELFTSAVEPSTLTKNSDAVRLKDVKVADVSATSAEGSAEANAAAWKSEFEGTLQEKVATSTVSKLYTDSAVELEKSREFASTLPAMLSPETEKHAGTYTGKFELGPVDPYATGTAGKAGITIKEAILSSWRSFLEMVRRSPPVLAKPITAITDSLTEAAAGVSAAASAAVTAGTGVGVGGAGKNCASDGSAGVGISISSISEENVDDVLDAYTARERKNKRNGSVASNVTAAISGISSGSGTEEAVGLEGLTSAVESMRADVAYPMDFLKSVGDSHHSAEKSVE